MTEEEEAGLYDEQNPQSEEDVSSTVTRTTVDSEDLASAAYYLGVENKPRVTHFKCPGWRSRKNFSFSNDHVSTIDHENQRLLGQLWRACGSNNAGKPPRVLTLYHSGLNRHRANQRIESENLRKLKRLETVKSTRFVKCSDQLEDYQRLAAYPGTPSLVKYKLPESSRNTSRKISSIASRDPSERKSLARWLIEAKEAENKRLNEQNMKRRGQQIGGLEDGTLTEEDGTTDGSENTGGFIEFVKSKFSDMVGWFKGGSSEDTLTLDTVSSTDVTNESNVQEEDDLQKQQLEFDKSSDMTQRSMVKQGDTSYSALGTPDDEYYGEHEEDQQSVLDIYTLGLKNRTNYSFPKDDVCRINQENMRLLREISRTSMPRTGSSVFRNTTWDSKTKPVLRPYHTGRNRKWAHQRIDTENLHVLKRVESVKSTPDIKRSTHLKNYQRLASYPGTQSLCRYDDSMLESAPSPTSKSSKVRVPRPDWIE